MQFYTKLVLCYWFKGPDLNIKLKIHITSHPVCQLHTMTHFFGTYELSTRWEYLGLSEHAMDCIGVLIVAYLVILLDKVL